MLEQCTGCLYLPSNHPTLEMRRIHATLIKKKTNQKKTTKIKKPHHYKTPQQTPEKPTKTKTKTPPPWVILFTQVNKCSPVQKKVKPCPITAKQNICKVFFEEPHSLLRNCFRVVSTTSVTKGLLGYPDVRFQRTTCNCCKDREV